MLKSLPKLLIIFFLAVFIIQLICLFFILAAPTASQATGIKFTPQVEIPGYTFNPADKTTGNIANLVKAIYKYAIGIVGILAAVVLMIGGILWIVAGGNATAIGEAKAWIAASLTGLVLALTSYLILATVNPDLVDLKTTKIKEVENKDYTLSNQPPLGTIYKWQCLPLSKPCEEVTDPPTVTLDRSTCEKDYGQAPSCPGAQSACCARLPDNALKGCCYIPTSRCENTNKAECDNRDKFMSIFTWQFKENGKCGTTPETQTSCQ